MKLRAIFITVLISVLLSACTTETEPPGSLHLLLARDAIITQQFDHEVVWVILNGALTIPANSLMRGDVIVLDGSLVVDGEFDGRISVLSGDLIIEEDALVEGEIRIVGGELSQAADATISASIQQGELELPTDRMTTGNLWLDAIVWFSVQTIPLMLLAIVLVHIWEQPLTRLEAAMTRYALVSGALGLLSAVVMLSIVVLIAFTIILLPVALLGVGLFFLMFGIALIAWGDILMRFIMNRFKFTLSKTTRTLIGVPLVMALFELSQLIPLLDVIAIIAVAVGFGALMLTRFGFQSFVPQSQMVEQSA